MNIIESSKCILKSNLSFLKKLGAEDYTFQIPEMSNSTIGQHARHFIELYQCLLDQHKNGCVNYSLRKRDKNIETDILSAIQALEVIIQSIQLINPDQELILMIDKDQSDSAKTNVKRELLYNLEHTIHHNAMMKIGLKMINPVFSFPEDFGIAPSTVQNQKKILQAS